MSQAMYVSVNGSPHMSQTMYVNVNGSPHMSQTMYVNTQIIRASKPCNGQINRVVVTRPESCDSLFHLNFSKV